MLRKIFSGGFRRFAGRFRAPLKGGRGRQPEGSGLGLGGECVCPKCNAKISHAIATPCYTLRCPKCGASMTRNE